MSSHGGAPSAFADGSFRRLWAAFSLAQVGSALGGVAIPLIAVRELGLSDATVALLATGAGLTMVIASLPAGYLAEFRRKRPVMITADLIRAGTFLLISVGSIAGALGVGVLLAAMVVNAAMSVLFGAASSAHTKDLLSPRTRADGLGKLQAAAWTAMVLGPAAAGVLAGAASPAVLTLDNAGTFLASALLVLSIPRPERSPSEPAPGVGKLALAGSGLRHLLRDRVLRRLFVSWLVFAGAVAAMTPVTQVFYLRDLAFTPLEYGLLLGVPSIGGVLGAWLTGRLTARLGTGRTLWWASLLRTPWYLVFPLAVGGAGGLIALMSAFTLVLFFSSVSNAAMTAVRMDLTPDALMARTSAAWTLATMGAGPLLIPVLGLVMELSGARVALWAIAALVLASVAVLPREALGRVSRP